MSARPKLAWTGLWNLSFGFFGIQIGFALQNANASRIFQTLGTPLDKLGLMWIAAPLTGLLVQPLVGYYSDRTWTRLGRRRPYFLAGAVLATLALVAMPQMPAIGLAAVTLWLLDASLNTCMEPFRAFVGDMLPEDQQPAGYAFQTAFIGAGAVVASLAPWLLEHVFHLANTAAPGVVPPTVRWSFSLGAAALMGAVAWTVLTTRERPPELEHADDLADAPAAAPAGGWRWIVGGVVLALALFACERAGWLASSGEALLVAASLVAFGAAQLWARHGRPPAALAHLVGDLAAMPPVLARLAGVQFLTWGALILMWVYTTPAIAHTGWHTLDPASAAYGDAATWVGVLFASYSGVATVAAFVLPRLAERYGVARTHALCLGIGALAFVGLFAVHRPVVLLAAMAGIGIAWASILTLPYVILVRAVPAAKLGAYVGLFNIFIVLPQLAAATIMGGVLKAWFPAAPEGVMLIAAALFAAAAAAMLRVPQAAGTGNSMR
ncbi:MAG: MFS transporter [Sphingomonadaceae bacterium]|nr:MFS transporter [Sphingomonadaceae bacterium]